MSNIIFHVYQDVKNPEKSHHRIMAKSMGFEMLLSCVTLDSYITHLGVSFPIWKMEIIESTSYRVNYLICFSEQYKGKYYYSSIIQRGN